MKLSCCYLCGLRRGADQMPLYFVCKGRWWGSWSWPNLLTAFSVFLILVCCVLCFLLASGFNLEENVVFQFSPFHEKLHASMLLRVLARRCALSLKIRKLLTPVRNSSKFSSNLCHIVQPLCEITRFSSRGCSRTTNYKLLLKCQSTYDNNNVYLYVWACGKIRHRTMLSDNFLNVYPTEIRCFF